MPVDAARYDASREALTRALREARRDALAPSPKLTLSEWAEQFGVLTAESSAEPGRFRAYGYQKGLLDAMSDPSSSVVALMKSARVGYTQLATFALAYYMEHDPTSTLFVLPTEDDARDFSKSSVAPLMKQCEPLAAIAGSSDSKDEWHTKYTSRGSVLRMRGAFSADTFRRITSRINIGDEIDGDGWDNGAKSQGDKIRLLRKRGETYWNAKTILGSTPTIKGGSRIESWYERGDQRRYFVPCPHCGEEFYLEWGGRGSTHGVKWPEGRPQDAYYVGPCGCVIEEKDKAWMDARGDWRPTADGEPGIHSYHISALYSLFPNAAWGKLAAEFIDAKADPEKLRTFANLVLGETWEDRSAAGAVREPHDLEELCVPYQEAVPAGVRLLTAGVDVQAKDGGRFEVSVYGWGAGEKCAHIAHVVLDEEPLDSPAAWENLSSFLSQPFRGEDGREYRIRAAAIDSGWNAQAVYEFTSKNAAKNWWAIKGSSRAKGMRGDRIWPTSASKVKSGHLMFSICQETCKDVLFRRLHGDTDGPAALIFPSEPIPGADPCDADFFTRLTRERPMPVKGKPGRVYWTTPPDQEPWDCLVYAYAATHGLRSLKNGSIYAAMLGSPTARRAAAQSDGESDADAPQSEAAQPKPKPQRRPRRRPTARVSSYL